MFNRISRPSFTRSSIATALLGLMILAGCSSGPLTSNQKADLEVQAASTIHSALTRHPFLAEEIKNSAGFAVFPDITKGGLAIGGAEGQGVVYLTGPGKDYNSSVIQGYSEMTQATIGGQIGGQEYVEFIFFETVDDVNRFKFHGTKAEAGATAVAINTNASTNVPYTEGVKIYTLNPNGLMAEAVVGAQSFKYTAKQ